jgi:hypothetical protein
MTKSDEPRRKSFANGNAGPGEPLPLDGFVLRPVHWWWLA